MKNAGVITFESDDTFAFIHKRVGPNGLMTYNALFRNDIWSMEFQSGLEERI